MRHLLRALSPDHRTTHGSTAPAGRGLRSSAALRGALAASLVLGGAMLPGCGGSESAVSSGPTNPSPSDFSVQTTNVVNGALWKLNRPIDIGFSEDIDFSSVSSNTIQIIDVTGIPAQGIFSLIGPRTVRWQPLCPTNDDNSNGGLLKNRTYLLTVVGSAGNAVTVLSTAGEPVDTGITVTFRTPNSNDPVELFVDQVAGPPSVLIRNLPGVDPTSEEVSFVEYGTGIKEFIEFQFASQEGRISSLVPLNLYSRADKQFSVVLQFNQPVNPASSNISPTLIQFEYQNGASGQWLPLQTAVFLQNNCTEVGAAVRATPQGLVPEGSELRLNIRDGFEDLTGDAIEADLVNFVRLTSEDSTTPGAIVGSDEITEEFTFGGGGADSREDLAADTTKPRATWGGGTVAPSFEFDGTGGPGGNFDWTIRTGQTVIIDTAADQIRGGPGGVETTTQTVINGVIDVRNMTVERNATLLFSGPNTATILASGFVNIYGTVSVNGGDNPGVKTLNTTNQPENGSAGGPGGGTGGTGSFLTAQNTPKGGNGSGAFERLGFGGEGGESCYSTGGKDRRRGAGGGGGTFSSTVTRYDVYDPAAPATVFVTDAICQTLIGFDPEPGFPGGDGGTGAVSQTDRSRGGDQGPFPFFDQFDDNNFLGTMRTAPVIDPLTMEILEPSRIIIGELSRVWAGAGGGGGGDAVNSNTFPVTPFNPAGDEKGSGGGGGAGGIQILAIGEIFIGRQDPLDPMDMGGSLTADGGYGGAGENVIFFDRVGGAGGGGAGGHVVLSSANRIVIDSEAPEGSGFNQALAFYGDAPAQLRHPLRPVSALGGQGGAGKDDRCGANADGDRDWKVDAIPVAAFEGSMDVPPLGNTPNNNTFMSCNTGSPNDPEGTAPGAGGDGGPGIIQFHASDLDTQILFPRRTGSYATGVDVTFSVSPPPLGWERPTESPDQMIPFFGDESESVSKWIALGEARRNANGTIDRVQYEFGGTDLMAAAFADQGVVLRNGTQVEELTPLVAYAGIVPGQATVPFVSNGDTVHFDATGVDNLYTQNPALLRNFVVRVRDSVTPANATDFRVLDATYDSGASEFACVVDPLGTLLADQITAFMPNGEVALIPNYFQVVAGGVQNLYPTNTEVRITFDATVVDRLTGLPDDSRSFSRVISMVSGELTPDITELGTSALPTPPAGQAPYTDWDFVRFRVEFDLDASGMSGVNLAGDRPALDYLRIPFRF